MDILTFSEELSRLIIRYTKGASSNNDGSRNAPLTKHEIRNAVHNVLAVILGDDECKADPPLTETPVSETVIVTPTAPTVPKIEQERHDDENRFRFLDHQPAVKDLSSFSVSPMQGNEEEGKQCLQVLQDGKKFISRSSPAICVTSVGRSDTFIREKQSTPKAESELNLNKISTNIETSDKFLLSLNEIRQSALNVVTKLDNLKKLAFPQSNLVRRLSGSLSSGSHSSSRMIAPKMRRSVTTLAATPTSSRSLIMEKEDVSDRRKSVGGATLTSRKLNESMRSRSVSTSNLSVSNKSPSSLTRPAKNPKYAHIQSTIPKPTKRKAC